MTQLELKEKTCCFTGHRILPPQEVRKIAADTAKKAVSLIAEKGVRFFGVGGAIGYDSLAAEVLFKLRETRFPEIKIILVCPFPGMTDRWTIEQRTRYDYLFPQYDKVVYLAYKASREAYLARNRHLVDWSSYCICYCSKGCGGTAYTIYYAREHGLEIHNIFDGAVISSIQPK